MIMSDEKIAYNEVRLVFIGRRQEPKYMICLIAQNRQSDISYKDNGLR